MGATPTEYELFYERERQSMQEALEELEAAAESSNARAATSEAMAATLRKQLSEVEEERSRSADSMQGAVDIAASLRAELDESELERRRTADSLRAASAESASLQAALEEERQRSSDLFLRLEASLVSKHADRKRAQDRVLELERRAEAAEEESSAAAAAASDKAKQSLRELEELRSVTAKERSQYLSELAKLKDLLEAETKIRAKAERQLANAECCAEERSCEIKEMQDQATRTARKFEMKLQAQQKYVAAVLQRVAKETSAVSTVNSQSPVVTKTSTESLTGCRGRTVMSTKNVKTKRTVLGNLGSNLATLPAR